MLFNELIDIILEIIALLWIYNKYSVDKTLTTGVWIIFIVAAIAFLKTLRNIIRLLRFKVGNSLVKSGMQIQGGTFDNLETMIRTNPEFRNYCRMLINRYDCGGFWF